MNRILFRTRIKFCGMTRPGDVRLAGELGVDAVGFIFAAGSPRRVEPEEARAMRNALAPLVSAVAVFRNNDGDSVREVVRQVRPSLLQFHGEEDDGFCRGFGLPYVKALPMGAPGALDAIELRLKFPGASGFLFDSHGGDAQPGGGRTFDWKRIPPGFDMPFFVAGGLDPGNVFEAIMETLPWGVDTCSGIENAPGVKDGDRMRRFVQEVRRADCVDLPERNVGG